MTDTLHLSQQLREQQRTIRRLQLAAIRHPYIDVRETARDVVQDIRERKLWAMAALSSIRAD